MGQGWCHPSSREILEMLSSLNLVENMARYHAGSSSHAIWRPLSKKNCKWKCPLESVYPKKWKVHTNLLSTISVIDWGWENSMSLTLSHMNSMIVKRFWWTGLTKPVAGCCTLFKSLQFIFMLNVERQLPKLPSIKLTKTSNRFDLKKATIFVTYFFNIHF